MFWSYVPNSLNGRGSNSNEINLYKLLENFDGNFRTRYKKVTFWDKTNSRKSHFSEFM